MGRLTVAERPISAGPANRPLGPARQPARVALMLALAHTIQEAIDAGAMRDRAEIARGLALRARG
jgi:hypothetical protein